MACSLTTDQVLARSKTVTRRFQSWGILRPGTSLCLVRKSMGRHRPDGTVEPLERLAIVRVTEVADERLDAITADEVAAEGFPDWTPEQFVRFFVDSHHGCGPSSSVRVIRFRYREDAFRDLYPDHYRRVADGWPDRVPPSWALGTSA